jgi:hypothetical protein
MKRLSVLIFLVLFLFTMGVASADAQGVQRVVYMEEYEPIYSVDIDNRIWDVEIDDGDIIGVSEDGMMWFFLGDARVAGDLKASADQIDETIKESFTNIEVIDTLKDFTINGLPSHAYEATAKQNGKDVILFVVLFQVETDDIGVLLFVMDPLAEIVHFDNVMKMATSVTRR